MITKQIAKDLYVTFHETHIEITALNSRGKTETHELPSDVIDEVFKWCQIHDSAYMEE
jgi:hypothetical protein